MKAISELRQHSPSDLESDRHLILDGKCEIRLNC